jgi:hypothetical protein
VAGVKAGLESCKAPSLAAQLIWQAFEPWPEQVCSRPGSPGGGRPMESGGQSDSHAKIKKLLTFRIPRPVLRLPPWLPAGAAPDILAKAITAPKAIDAESPASFATHKSDRRTIKFQLITGFALVSYWLRIHANGTKHDLRGQRRYCRGQRIPRRVTFSQMGDRDTANLANLY